MTGKFRGVFYLFVLFAVVAAVATAVSLTDGQRVGALIMGLTAVFFAWAAWYICPWRAGPPAISDEEWRAKPLQRLLRRLKLTWLTGPEEPRDGDSCHR